MATASELQQLYVGYFGRAADQTGLNFWLEAINNGGLSLQNVHTSFVQSEEYTAQYEGLSSSDLVAQVYLNVLGREADADGLAFWANAIDTGVISEDQLIEGVLSGLSPADALIVSNKVTVANYYTAVRGDAYGEADKAQSGDILLGVNGQTSTVATALQTIADTVDGPGASNDALAAALLSLEAAQNAQEAYAQAYLDDENGTVGAAATAIADAVTAARSDLNDAITAVGGTTIGGSDSNAIVQVRLTEATNAAATAVTNAQSAVNNVPGLNVAASSYANALTAHNNAVAAADAAELTQNAELARFNVVNNSTATIDSQTGVVAGVLAVTNGQLAVSNSFLATANDAQKAAANDLLVDVQARLNADAAEARTLASVTAAADRVKTLDSNAVVDTDGYTLTAGLVSNLVQARANQAELVEEIADYNEAQADAAQWASLGQAVTDAGDAIADLGYTIVDVADQANVTAGASDEVFFFTGTGAAGSATIGGFDGGDVLFVGTGYVLGTDSDPATAGIQGGNNAALEVFFTQLDNNGGVLVSIETSPFGSNAAQPELQQITLTGVTVDQVSFDANTGFVTHA